jgi:hypothetical protein
MSKQLVQDIKYLEHKERILSIETEKDLLCLKNDRLSSAKSDSLQTGPMMREDEENALCKSLSWYSKFERTNVINDLSFIHLHSSQIPRWTNGTHHANLSIPTVSLSCPIALCKAYAACPLSVFIPPATRYL